MQTEYEATFWPIDKDEVRARLTAAGATLVYPERLMRRYAFDLPPGLASMHSWARVRDEGDRITMSVKKIEGERIEDQKEVQVTVSDFESAAELLREVGCQQKAFQETKRELWKLGNTEITVDEWPFLDPLLEIEGSSEQVVREAAEALGLSWSKARFCAVGALYMERYGTTTERINNGTPRITFDGPNPFQN